MNGFHYEAGELCAEGLPLRQVIDAVGTPAYVYSRGAILERYHEVCRAFAPVDALVCYAVKANSNLAILRALVELQAGFDVVSIGELQRVLAAGGQAARCVFAGVGKTDDEIRDALQAGVLLINAEGVEELERIDALAADVGVRPQVALRVNPDVDAHTHAYITTGKKENKFGVSMRLASEVFGAADHFRHVHLAGLHLHIGSQIVSPQPYAQSLERIALLLAQIRRHGIEPRWLDIGGGFGIRYRDEEMHADDLARALLPMLRSFGCRVVLEPGRYLVGNAGVLVVRVTFVKRTAGKTFVITDGGMNDLIRPTLYGAFHEIVPLRQAVDSRCELVDVVGPICETGDFFAQDRELPVVARGDLLAIMSAGAYGFVMASNYNTRPRPPEVLVDGDQLKVVRRRETLDDLLGPER
ncbi:MAG: diaminopimelate decarboxylase [Planctomycetota bacterium]